MSWNFSAVKHGAGLPCHGECRGWSLARLIPYGHQHPGFKSEQWSLVPGSRSQDGHSHKHYVINFLPKPGVSSQVILWFCPMTQVASGWRSREKRGIGEAGKGGKRTERSAAVDLNGKCPPEGHWFEHLVRRRFLNLRN